MKLIIFSGPTSSGKDTVINELLKRLGDLYPGKVSRAEYFKTRPVRPNESNNSYFISHADFEQKLTSGLIEEVYTAVLENYKVGYSISEFKKSEIVLVNIDDKKALHLKNSTLTLGGRALTIFLHAPEDVRRERFRLRSGLLNDEAFKLRSLNDVADPDPKKHEDFDLRVENRQGELIKTLEVITSKIIEFLK